MIHTAHVAGILSHISSIYEEGSSVMSIIVDGDVYESMYFRCVSSGPPTHEKKGLEKKRIC